MVDEKVLHVHDVLGLLENSNKEQYTKNELKEEIESKFGSDLKFKTCSDNSFSFDEIIEFMKEKGKIEVDESAVIKFTCSVCQH